MNLHTDRGEKMLTKEDLYKVTLRLYEFCQYNCLPQTAAVHYKILFHLLDKPYDDKELTTLLPTFLSSDIVEELYQEQDMYGGWGRLQSKDYSAKDKFPTSMTAINRCFRAEGILLFAHILFLI